MWRFIVLTIFVGSFSLSAAADPVKILPRSSKEDLPTPRVLSHFENGFTLGENPVVVLTGGTNVVKQSENAYFETLLIRFAGTKEIDVRNLGWQSDTVYLQQRPRSFDTHFETLQRVDASIIIASFGQMESLDGAAEIPDFISAYRQLLDEYSKKTQQIVLVTPHPFEKPKSNLVPDLSKHNAAVAAYSAAIKSLAAERKFISVDLTDFEVSGLTRDGIHLTDEGHWQLAFETVSQLTGSSPISGQALAPDGTFTNPNTEKLRQAVIRKNFLWHQHWRPTNWAFAYGNRQNVPSSQDHRPGKPRWMPAEIDGIINLIEAAEAEIANLNQP